MRVVRDHPPRGGVGLVHGGEAFQVAKLLGQTPVLGRIVGISAAPAPLEHALVDGHRGELVARLQVNAPAQVVDPRAQLLQGDPPVMQSLTRPRDGCADGITPGGLGDRPHLRQHRLVQALDRTHGGQQALDVDPADDRLPLPVPACPLVRPQSPVQFVDDVRHPFRALSVGDEALVPPGVHRHREALFAQHQGFGETPAVLAPEAEIAARILVEHRFRVAVGIESQRTREGLVRAVVDSLGVGDDAPDPGVADIAAQSGDALREGLRAEGPPAADHRDVEEGDRLILLREAARPPAVQRVAVVFHHAGEPLGPFVANPGRDGVHFAVGEVPIAHIDGCVGDVSS